jgi:DNA-binding MarR family transcriptional regulator
MYIFKMNEVPKPLSSPSQDETDHHYDPRVRAALEPFALKGNLPLLEAASALRAAAHAIDTLRAQGATGQGLNAGTLNILLQLDLGTEHAVRISDLSALLGVSPRNVTGLVDTLERQGYVRRTPDNQDRRAVHVSITSAGSEIIQALRKPTQLAMDAVFHGFTTDDLVQLRHLCLQVTENAARIRARGEQP